MNKAAAYHEWLGVSLSNEHPNHYEILGIPIFETNRNVISNGAARRVTFLQTMVSGQFAELAQEIQKEISQAKLCLMREESRTKYQAEMMKLLAASDEPFVEKIESTFSVAEDFTEGSMDLFVDETRQQNLELSQQEIWLIGSSHECDMTIQNHYVSRKHCLLFRNGKQFELEDWASTNGTYVNNKLLTARRRTKISTQDIVTLGKCTLMPWPPLMD